MSVVIADTGPIHYLILIEQISLLPVLFGQVIIPDTVRNEMLNYKTPDPVRQWIETPPAWLEILPDPNSQPEELALIELDEGERAAIQLALSLKAALILMDDRAGVIAAKEKGLLVTGTLGVLDLAAERGLTDIESSLQRLTATNFRYKQALINRILDSSRKRNQQPSQK